MENPTRLYLLRHGEVEASYHRVFGGRIDMELSPRGHEQVQALADYFHRHPPHVMYASPMKRVRQTLAPLAKQTGLEPIIIPGLREVDFGDWTGLSWEQVQERFNVSAFEWCQQLEAGAITGAEPMPAYRGRVQEALERIQRDSPCKEIAVVCHGGVIRMILAILLDIPFAKTGSLDIEYASITKVRIRPNKLDVELLNFSPWKDL